MHRLELVVVELEETKRLIRLGRVPHLRLALILLDSAVELILFRLAEYALRPERYHFNTLKQMRPPQPGARAAAVWSPRSSGFGAW